MRKPQVGRGNGGSSIFCFMPLHNALGIENWPQHVQDDHARLFPRKFIPIEELIIAELDGRSVLNDDQEEEREVNYCGEEETEEAVAIQDVSAGGEDDHLDTEEKFQAYYRQMHPGFFPVRMSDFKDYDMRPEARFTTNFYGATRQNITPKTHRRAEPNAKKGRPRRYPERETIRDIHFNNLVREAEEDLFAQ